MQITDPPGYWKSVGSSLYTSDNVRKTAAQHDHSVSSLNIPDPAIHIAMLILVFFRSVVLSTPLLVTTTIHLVRCDASTAGDTFFQTLSPHNCWEAHRRHVYHPFSYGNGLQYSREKTTYCSPLLPSVVGELDQVFQIGPLLIQPTDSWPKWNKCQGQGALVILMIYRNFPPIFVASSHTFHVDLLT